MAYSVHQDTFWGCKLFEAVWKIKQNIQKNCAPYEDDDGECGWVMVQRTKQKAGNKWVLKTKIKQASGLFKGRRENRQEVFPGKAGRTRGELSCAF